MMQTPRILPYHGAAAAPFDKVGDRVKDFLNDAVDKVADVARRPRTSCPAIQVQRSESTGYRAASLARNCDVAASLNIAIIEHAVLGKPGVA